MPGSEAIQDYAKAIFKLEERGQGAAISTSALAEELELSPGSVTAMVKRMSEMGLASHEPYRGVTLTDDGRRVAIETLRHHRLLELYLAQVLGMPWDRVHAEAEVLEHHISEELEELISAALGHPTHDPHGDPIPSRELELDSQATLPLADLSPGTCGVFVRISDSDSEMLRYLGSRGVAPGDRIEVLEQQPFDGPVIVRIAGTDHPLGRRLAAAMRVGGVDAGTGEQGAG